MSNHLTPSKQTKTFNFVFFMDPHLASLKAWYIMIMSYAIAQHEKHQLISEQNKFYECNPLLMGPTHNGMVPILVTVLLACRAGTSSGVDRGPQPVEDRVPELLWPDM